MSVMLDIIYATILGAVITIIVINANLVIRQTWAGYNSDIIVQQSLISTAQVVESEFRNIGCGVFSDTSKKIWEAMDTCITFRMAFRPEPGAAIHTVKYYSGSVDELNGPGKTDNPNDRYLYRKEDAGAVRAVGVVTRFNIKYFGFANDTLPMPIVDCGDIGIVEITMEVQTPNASYIDFDGKKRYASALWKQTRLASQNIRR